MQLTDEQLAGAKAALEEKKRIVEWMQENELSRDDIKPRDIITQLNEKYGQEVMQPIMQGLRQSMIGRQITMMTSRIIERPNLTVETCDALIGNLQDALVTVQAKKAQLEG